MSKRFNIIKNLSHYGDQSSYIENYDFSDVVVLPDYGAGYYYLFENGQWLLCLSRPPWTRNLDLPSSDSIQAYIICYSIFISEDRSIDIELKSKENVCDMQTQKDFKYIVENLIELDYQALSMGGKYKEDYEKHEGHLVGITIDREYDELVFSYHNNYCNSSWSAFFVRDKTETHWVFSEIG